MSKAELIIFDCDGVLVDSETITNQILVDYINEFGTDLTLEDALERFRGGSLSDSVEYIRREYGIELPTDFAPNFRARMKTAFEKELQAVEGVKDLIQSLDQKICIASNGPMEKMETTLRVTGLKNFFGKNVFSAYQINKWKPDPALFLHAAEQMGVEARNCTVIEDSPRGLQAATSAGMKSYGFDVYGKPAELKKEGAILFTKMHDLIGKI